MKGKALLIILLLLLLAALVFYFVLPERKPVPTVGHPGLPTHPQNNLLIRHTYYTLSYNEKYEQPDWVMVQLKADYLTSSGHSRTDDFRVDPLVTTGSATPQDYRGSGYDRGHLLPAADMGWSATAMSETFFMSNMSPQDPRFNRGIWKKLETQVREWAGSEGELYIVTGPVLQGDLPTIGENEVAVPRYFYKAILDYKEPELKAIGFVMANQRLDLPLVRYAVTIDSVETLTGLDFFSDLPDPLEDHIEGSVDLRRWALE